MKTILINGEGVQVSIETYQRIVKIAKSEKLTFSDAVIFLLQKVI